MQKINRLSCIKNNKGISLITLTISIIVIVILTNVLIYNVKDNLKVGKLKEMQNDIENLRDKVASYYAQNGKIPASIKYTNIDHIKTAGVINEATDTGDFFVIDLLALDNLTLNYGEDFKKQLTEENVNQYTDLYIINETSQNIFYVAGITVDADTFYTDYTSDEVDLATVNLRYVENVKIPDGFYYVGGTKSTGIVISDVQGDDLNNTKKGNQFVWVPVENINDFYTIEGYFDGRLDSKLSYCSEPYMNGYATEVAEYNEMYKSVKKNHGFYIGRFEAGKIDNQVVVKKDVPVYNDIIWGDSMTDITGGAVELSQNFANDNEYTSVTSTLCYGVQWDATMQFIDNNYITGNCDSNSYVRNSTDKGNYSGSLINTGSNDNYSIKNIYDMAGNVTEWTMEACNPKFDSCRVHRGGYYDQNSSYPSVSNRNYVDTSVSYDRGTFEYVGFRIALYLNNEEKWSPTYDQEGTYKDKNGDTAYIPQGFQVSEISGQNTIDEGLVVKDSNDNEWVWIEVPKSIYTTATSNTDYENIEKDMQAYASDYRDSNYTDTWYSEEQHGFASSSDYNNYKNNMLKSVYDNGGFYIGKYEVGTQTARASENDTLTTPIIQQDAYPYNYVTCKQAQSLSNQLATGGNTSSLMFGIQWDLVLKYIETKGGKIQDELKSDSITWGNYHNATFDITRGSYTTSPTTVGSWLKVTTSYTKPQSTSVLLTAGVAERNSTLNIYDLAGNVWEWTLEYTSNIDYPSSFRGGDFGDNGVYIFPASYRFYDRATLSLYSVGFRPALY